MDKLQCRLPFIFLLFLFFKVVVLFSQSVTNNEIFKAYDDLVGLENAGFFNGPEFKDEYANSSGVSRYFNQNIFFTDSAIEYNGQLYVNIPLEYDIFSDNVITKSQDYLSNFIVRLIPEYISKFTLEGHNFVKLTDSKLDLVGNGFYEIASIGNQFKLYLKHIRKDKERTLALSVQHSFTNQNYYLLQYEGSHYIISSIKDFKRVVPYRYKEIQKFRKDYKFMYKDDNYNFMIKLIEYLNGY
ncbi:hypothetical protein DHD05_20755 [Arenibacter sp. N53]|uniref:hypothetical protein n=1 Tax=Arenibacter TaxID=178469 RepID=UPI000CD45A57|nr:MULTISPECIES: hypothetical protein [Arenibacter]MCM4154027.1 hypothetical protein [Arenibacter sp. N53]